MRTYRGEPTLNDTQVLEFCKKGFLMLEGVVADDINRRTLEYTDAHREIAPNGILEVARPARPPSRPSGSPGAWTERPAEPPKRARGRSTQEVAL